jgi:hypothetical protein
MGTSDGVPESHLEAPHDVCPVCGAWDSRSFSLWLQREPDIALLACEQCHASSADRFPDAAFLKSLYAPDDYASDLLSSPAAVDNCARHIAARMPADVDRNLRILDYGGSDGSLSRSFRRALRERGQRGTLDFTVVDHFVDQRSDPEIRFRDVAEFETLSQPYDIVLASAVLEHLPDLPGTARKLLSLCSSGGLFYARTPFEAPLARLVPGYAIRWPRHLHDLGPRFWARFLDLHGFRGEVLHSAPSVVESDFSSRPLRTFLAHCLKAPARIDAALRGDRIRQEGRIAWPFVGGWEVVLRVEGTRG